MTRGRVRRMLLGRFDLDEQLEAEYERSGLLEVWFRAAAKGGAHVESLDGNRTIAFVAPGGAIQGLLVQDYANRETRIVPFPFGDIEIANDGEHISIFLMRATGSRPGSRRRPDR